MDGQVKNIPSQFRCASIIKINQSTVRTGKLVFKLLEIHAWIIYRVLIQQLSSKFKHKCICGYPSRKCTSNFYKFATNILEPILYLIYIININVKVLKIKMKNKKKIMYFGWWKKPGSWYSNVNRVSAFSFGYMA